MNPFYHELQFDCVKKKNSTVFRQFRRSCLFLVLTFMDFNLFSYSYYINYIRKLYRYLSYSMLFAHLDINNSTIPQKFFRQQLWEFCIWHLPIENFFTIIKPGYTNTSLYNFIFFFIWCFTCICTVLSS